MSGESAATNMRPWLFVLLAVLMAVGWAGACVIWRAAEVGELVGPIDPVSYESLTIVTVGTGADRENPERLGPVTAIGRGDAVLLVDAGRGIAEALRAAGIPLDQPTTVFLTSLLPSSTVGLDDLLVSGWIAGRKEPLRVVGPRGTSRFVETLQEAYRASLEAEAEGLGLPEEGAWIDAEEAGDGWEETLEEIGIRAAMIPDALMPALAWRFEADRRSVVVSGVGGSANALIAAAKRADVWVAEAVYIPEPEDLEEAGVLADPEQLRREKAAHTSLLEIGKLAERAGVGELVLIRMHPPPFFALQVTSLIGDDFSGTVIVANDGDEVAP